MSTHRYWWSRVKSFLLLFLSLETITRFVFISKEWAQLEGIGDITRCLIVGLVYDLYVFAYFLLALTLYLLLLPKQFHGTSRDRIISSILYGIFSYILLFTSIAEWFFWDEFAARFNFIAVDYLIYTHEVIGNIQESYPIYPILSAIAFIAFIFGWLHARRPLATCQPAFMQRLKITFLAVVLAMVSYFTVDSDWSETGSNRFEHEIAKNGIFELFSAYLNNELDYQRFYAASDNKKMLLEKLRKEIGDNQSHFLDDGITRHIDSPGVEKNYNIMMITVESLGSNYLGAFGNKEGLTPNLDRLAKESLFFTNLYATGTRTVYGLSALTLSIPPLPGNALIRRPENENLFSLASVLNKKGYVSKFIYGGYGYFDNMNYFYQHNGYEIVDRTSLSTDEITFGNVWGVADEDLFRRAIKENDKAHAAGKPFFDMVLTTSNHRPFTYPEGRIDIPSKSGRRGGVKYTDYAIGKLIEQSRSRPWFKNTIFVIVADHTAGGAGKSELDPNAYNIPMLIYAPGLVPQGKVETLVSQIDVAPTLLGLLNMDYDSRFYGSDVLRHPPERALISNYQQLGYLTKDELTVLKPVKEIQQYKRDQSGNFVPMFGRDITQEQLALSYFQNADRWREWNQRTLQICIH